MGSYKLINGNYHWFQYPSEYPLMTNPFEYHQPNEDQLSRINYLRASFYATYLDILDSVPYSAERTVAIRKLEEASMWANKAITFEHIEPKDE